MGSSRPDTTGAAGGARRLEELLQREELVTAEQLEQARHRQHDHGESLGEAVVALGFITEAQLAAVRSLQMNLPLIDLRRHTVQPRALGIIPEEMARRHVFIPMDIVNDSLMVVMANPEDVRTIEDIRARAGMKIDVGLGVRSEIEQAIDLNYRASRAIEDNVSRIEPGREEVPAAPVTAEVRTPVAETLELLIAQAVKDRASDLHLEPQDDRLRVRFRIDGILHDMYSFPVAAHQRLVSRVKILAQMDISEQRRPQDGQFSLVIGGRAVDIRAATLDTPRGERVALRILDKSLALFTLAELGLRPEVLKRYRELLRSPIGMALVSGPTGSGKTTTLYASIGELSRDERNIMTIEDPIEYTFLDINQTQVNARAGITFAGGLRAIMRHDPDIILVGEIRDADTAETAVQSALTGHLVLSCVHANDASGALFRLEDLDIEPARLSSTVIAVLAQRMVRKICPTCRTPYEPTPAELNAYREELPDAPDEFSRGAGCNLCANTGYRGRTGIFELLIMSDDIRDLLRAGAAAADLRRRAIGAGMITMRQDGMLKVRDGVTTISEVTRSVFSLS